VWIGETGRTASTGQRNSNSVPGHQLVFLSNRGQLHYARADTGSNLRIDQTACQYAYNLAATTLGVGTYRVDITINGLVVRQRRCSRSNSDFVPSEIRRSHSKCDLPYIEA
jgi:hypothetical protein